MWAELRPIVFTSFPKDSFRIVGQRKIKKTGQSLKKLWCPQEATKGIPWKVVVRVCHKSFLECDRGSKDPNCATLVIFRSQLTKQEHID